MESRSKEEELLQTCTDIAPRVRSSTSQGSASSPDGGAAFDEVLDTMSPIASRLAAFDRARKFSSPETPDYKRLARLRLGADDDAEEGGLDVPVGRARTR